MCVLLFYRKKEITKLKQKCPFFVLQIIKWEGKTGDLVPVRGVGSGEMVKKSECGINIMCTGT
jgi:hypothetical protein